MRTVPPLTQSDWLPDAAGAPLRIVPFRNVTFPFSTRSTSDHHPSGVLSVRPFRSMVNVPSHT